MSAAVMQLADVRRRRVAHQPFVAVFLRAQLALDQTHHFSTSEWRIMDFACATMLYGQRVPWNGATLARELGYTRQTVYKSLRRLQQVGVLYKHRVHQHAPLDWYVSAYIGYRGKLNALARVRQWEDLIKAAATRGETVDVELAAEHYYAGGVPDDETPTLPDWLEDA